MPAPDVVGLAAAAVLLPALGSMFVLRGAKLQTALFRVLLVWLFAGALVAMWMTRVVDSGFVAVALFWAGAFRTWFGVASHLESSILLRMLMVLRTSPMTDDQLVARYTTLHSEPMRLGELRRGGFIAGERDDLHVTPKGKLVLFVTSRLR